MMFQKTGHILILFILVNIPQNQDERLIIGTWVSNQDSNWRLEFIDTNLCIQYYTGEPNEEYAYTISNSSPQCGYDVLVDDTTSYLQLVNKATGESLCYEINGIARETLSLRPVDKGGIMLFNRE